MALGLTFSLVERNDNKVLIVQDTTGRNTETLQGWGEGSNPDIDDIDSLDSTLTLGVTIKLSSGTSTIYTAINLYDVFADGGFNTIEYPSNMEFNINPSMLLDTDGNPLGIEDSEFPDGIYYLTYTYSPDGGTPVVYEETFYIDGVIRANIYDILRRLPEHYNNMSMMTYETYTEDWKFIQNVDFMWTYMKSIEASSYVAKIDNILNSLQILQNIVIDVNNKIR